MLKLNSGSEVMRIGFAYANPYIHDFLTGASLEAEAVRYYQIELFNLFEEASPDLLARILDAQTTQARNRKASPA
jgi:hypothetical protein